MAEPVILALDDQQVPRAVQWDVRCRYARVHRHQVGRARGPFGRRCRPVRETPWNTIACLAAGSASTETHFTAKLLVDNRQNGG
jgi:hypothetical protein